MSRKINILPRIKHYKYLSQLSKLGDFLMAHIYDAGTFSTLQADLGGVDALLQAVGNANGSATNALINIRDVDVLENFNSDDYSNIVTLEDTLRNVVSSLPTTIGGILTSVVKSLDNYFIKQLGMKLRLYYNGLNAGTAPSWNTDFLSLWRRIMAEEIVVKISTITNTAGTWAATTPATWTIGTSLQVRVPSANTITSAVTLTATGTLVTGGTESITLTIPIHGNGDPINLIDIANGKKYTAISSISATGGGNGDAFQIWLK